MGNRQSRWALVVVSACQSLACNLPGGGVNRQPDPSSPAGGDPGPVSMARGVGPEGARLSEGPVELVIPPGALTSTRQIRVTLLDRPGC